MGQIVHNNPEENVNLIINNEMVLPNNQQVSLHDALEVVPLFDGSNIPLSHFIEGSYEAKGNAANTRSSRKFSTIIEK